MIPFRSDLTVQVLRDSAGAHSKYPKHCDGKSPEAPNPKFGFRVSDSGFQVSELGLRVSDLGFRARNL